MSAPEPTVTRRLQVRYTATWTTEIAVQLPDRAVTASEVDAAIEAAEIDLDPDFADDLEEVDRRWIGDGPTISEFGRVPPVPEDAWVATQRAGPDGEMVAERWACTACLIVREGAPMPTQSTTELDTEWLRVDAAGAVQILASAEDRTSRPPAQARFDRAFAPLLRGGDVWLVGGASADRLSPVSVWRDGVLCAVIAQRIGAPWVDAAGRVVP